MRDRNGSFPLVVLCALALCCPSILWADTSENVSLYVGEEFTVVREYPGTGYGAWYLVSSVPSWLELVDQTAVPVNPGLPGTPYTYYWLFRAKDYGNTTLRFEFQNVGGGAVVSTHLCQVTATVQAEPEVTYAAAGGTFTVRLPSPWSDGGCSWSLAGSLPSWLVQTDKKAIPWDRFPAIVGSPVTEYWTFQATTVGSTSLTFQYMRPWEGTILKTHVCQVTALAPTDVENVTVAVGEEFKVEQRFCIGCAYRWVLAWSLPSWLELVSDVKTPDPRPPGTVGGMGTETWTFRATGSGSTSLTFLYQPGKSPPDKVYVCHVTTGSAADPSLVLYLPLNEGAGTTAGDSSSYHNPGTIVGGAWVPGHSGTALNFTTANTHVTVPEIPAYDVTSAVTLMAWVKSTGNPDFGRLIDKFQYLSSGVNLSLWKATGEPMLQMCVNGTTSLARGQTSVMDGQWHFVAGTFGNKTLRIYVDGRKEAETPSVGNLNILPNDWPIMIGGGASVNGFEQLLGSIDEVAMYNRELSPDEVMAVFQNGINPTPSTCQPEVTSVKIIKLQLAGSGFSQVGEVSTVEVGDFFTIWIDVKNQGSTPVATTGNLYGYAFSGPGDVEEVTSPSLQVCLAGPGTLAPGQSMKMMPFCGNMAFQATKAGSITMDIHENNCQQTFTFEIKSSGITPSPCQVEVTGVKFVRLRAAGNQFTELGEVGWVAVGDLFSTKIQVTNRGSTPVSVGSPYSWSFSAGPGQVNVVGQSCACASLVPLQPGASATLPPFCCQAFQAATAGAVTMDVDVGGNCLYSITFEIW